MRHLLFALLALPLLAQQPVPSPPQAEAKPAAKPAEAKPADAPAEQKAESPAPVVESPFSGSIDVGARWVSGVGGDFNTYRSIVNLGEGIRLIGLELNYQQETGKLLDEFHLQGYNWGGDPYNSARLDAGKRGLWRYLGTYSNTAYFNYLPSFANPGATPGVTPPGAAPIPFLNQRSYDTAIRNFDNLLELMPGRRIIPYIGYQRNSLTGYGVTTMVFDQNEYPLRNLLDWGQNLYRGGARFEFSRFHATLEGGSTAYKEDQHVASTERLTGNRTTPVFGRTLFLEDGRQAYGIRGSGPFAKALATANVTRWADVYGQFLWAQPDVTTTFNQNNTGNFLDQASGILFYSQGRDSLTGNARHPHSSGLLGGEVRVGSKLRVRESWMTDRFHTASSSLLTASLSGISGSPGQTITRTTPYDDRLEVNNTRNQVEALLDITPRVMLRGGWRYETGDALVRAGKLNPFGPFEEGRMERNVGLVGLQARPVQAMTVNLDFERGDGKQTYFRTGLMTYYKFRTQLRYQIVADLHVNALYSILNNENPSAGVGLLYQAQQGSISVQWLPHKMKAFSLLGDYTRSSIYSDITYLVPIGLTPLRSLYEDDAHTGTLLADWTLAPKFGASPRISAGGSFVRTTGSRPSQYYQPIGRILLPVHPRFHIYSEWRWYGLTQPLYLYEGFRTHQLLTGIRFII